MKKKVYIPLLIIVNFFIIFLLQPFSLFGATITVTNTNNAGASSLREAITNSTGDDTIVFNVSGTITLASELPEIVSKNNLIINGAGQTIVIDGSSTYRPFFVSSTGCEILNLTLQNCTANGGEGGSGGGGGGGGLGGAILINSTGAATVTNLTFTSNSAIGGSGGAGTTIEGNGGGGGGGLGGNGGICVGESPNLGGGGGGGTFVGENGGNGGESGGSAGGSTGGVGGDPGPFQGSDGSAYGGAGGGGGDDATGPGPGGPGGFAGGGGGGGNAEDGAIEAGSGGNGGAFAGGGGGGGVFTTEAGGPGGLGGGNGGAGGTTGGGGGGGGAGVGGNIFVRTGGSLTLNSSVTAGTVTAGTAGAGAGNGSAGTVGQAGGSGIFIQSGTLAFSISGTETVAGVIADGASLTGGSGIGNLTQTGSGTLILSGTNTYTGTTTVNAGTLTVNGSIETSSLTTIASGATLKGTGTIGALTIASGGTLDPGNSIGTTVVAGNYTQSTGSTLNIEISPSATSLVDISGTATIEAGATLLIIPQAGTYTAITHTFLDADGGLSGTFDTITIDTTNFSGDVTHEVSYTATEGQIVLTGTLVALAAAGPAPGDTAILDLTSDLATRINRSQMGLITEIQNQRFLQREICHYLPTSCKKNNSKPWADRAPFFRKQEHEKSQKICDDQDFYHPYLVVDYSRADVRKRKHMLSGKGYLRALITGCDFYLTKDFVAGGSVGYTNGDASSNEGFGHITSNSFNLGAYFQAYMKKNFFLDGAFSWGKNYYESKRSISGFNSAKYHGYDLASQLRILYQSYFTKVTYRPYISGTYYLQQTGNYTERRNDTNRLKVGKDHYNFFELGFGVAFWAPFEVRCWTIAPQFSFAYVRNYLCKPHDIKATFISNFNGNQSVRVANVTNKQWKVQAGLSAHYLHCSEIFFTYEALFDNAYSNYQEYRLGAQRGF